MISRDKTLIIIAIVVGVGTLAGVIGFIGQGNVRHVSIFWQERVEQTVAFEDIDGKVQLQGISGIGGEANPYLITRTSFAYILTVINNGDKHHRLYIEGLDVQTDLLEPGQHETLTIYPDKEGIYKYFDKRERLEHLGFLEVKTVVHSDEFVGIWRDLL
ncbi:MAG: cupredoxin domain-containing protein [Nitrosopumilus sp.]|nr:cupredoxin domain-containing protein [Nitrosopumilus sp.]MDH3490149.1 cupredoxin domain-containing protein [Nitrosopumilus sp.]MDH3516888.1 cupredoxin domain-containing protein [Nitrosopumilus sp.]MDH3565262.1 cupredoxin domain-containing protein [Nitrosopumilus sp.]MDH5416681.1 cupredoxin domain-containing protein [Nitrosopumilus sp.]